MPQALLLCHLNASLDEYVCMMGVIKCDGFSLLMRVHLFKLISDRVYLAQYLIGNRGVNLE